MAIHRRIFPFCNIFEVSQNRCYLIAYMYTHHTHVYPKYVIPLFSHIQQYVPQSHSFERGKTGGSAASCPESSRNNCYLRHRSPFKAFEQLYRVTNNIVLPYCYRCIQTLTNGTALINMRVFV